MFFFSKTFILKGNKTILENSCLQLDWKIYNQDEGTATEAKFAATYASLDLAYTDAELEIKS